jgi:flagellar biogenesis protein FliO
LPPRPSSLHSGEGNPASTDANSKFASPTAATLAGSTCVVLSLFLVAAWLMKRAAPKSMQSLPTAAVEVLGRAPLVRGQHLQLVRCGGRLLLLSVSATSSQTLVEIGDPHEVESLLAACGGSGGRFAPQVENPRTQRDRHNETADRVSQLLSSVSEDLRPALSGAGRHG